MAEHQNDQTDIEPLSDEALEEVAGGLASDSSGSCCSCSGCSNSGPIKPSEPTDPIYV